MVISIVHLKKINQQILEKLATFYSSNMLFVLSFFNFFSLIFLNKKVDIASLNLVGLNFRFPQLFALLLVPLFFKNIKENIYLVLFLVLGVLNLLISIQYDFKYSLANFGIYYYSLYFFLGKLFSEKSYLSIFLRVLPAMTILGIINFIITYAIEMGTLPIGIHMSSDILPILSLASIFVVTNSNDYSQTKKINLTIFFIFFILLVKIKGPVLVLFGISILLRLNKIKQFSKIYCAIILVFVSIKFLFNDYFFSTLFFYLKENFSIGKDQLFNIGSRLIMWEQATDYIKDNYFFGNGITSLDCLNIETLWPDWIGSSSENVNPHNSFLFLTYFGGVFSLLPFLRVSFYELIKSSHRNESISILILIFLLLSFITPVLELYYLAPFFWFLVGGLNTVNRHFFQQIP